MPIPQPFSTQRLVEALSEARGRTIELVSARLGATAPSGLLVRTADVDYICYARNTTPLHQLHIILHEIGHLVLGHEVHQIRAVLETPVSTTTPPEAEPDGRGRPRTTPTHSPMSSPTPASPPTSCRSFADNDEREAEVYATLAGECIAQTVKASEWAMPGTLEVQRHESMFDLPAPRRACDG